MILLDPIGLGESTDGDSNDDEDGTGVNNTLSSEDASVECNFTFIGANVISGKSSIRSKPKDKKVKFLYYLLLLLFPPIKTNASRQRIFSK